MPIIFYCNENNKAGEELIKNITRKISLRNIKVERTLESLSGRLRKPLPNAVVILLVAESKKELEQLVSLQELMTDYPVVLLLPDMERSTISLGHKLYPRFVTHIKARREEIVSVLGRLFRHAHRNGSYLAQAYRPQKGEVKDLIPLLAPETESGTAQVESSEDNEGWI